jgi:erythromycin esterase-like protein
MIRQFSRKPRFTNKGTGHFLLCALVAVSACSASRADDKASLAEQLAGQRMSITLEGGKLAGPGAKALLSAGLESQYVMIGEDHGGAEIAGFSAAYFSELARGGFTALAIEDGPAVAAAIQVAVKGPNPVSEIAAFDTAFPFSTAFYNLRPEAEFLASVARAAGPTFQLWGVDQELMGSSKFLLGQIGHENVGAAAHAQIAALLKEEGEFYAKACVSGDPTQLLMLGVKEEEFAALRQELVKSGNQHALELIDALLESRSIYTKNMTAGQGYASNVERGRLMKTIMDAHLAANPGQRVLVKIGAYHAYRGISPLGTRELGNYLAEYAEGMGRKSLHVLVYAPTGLQSQFAGVGRKSQAMAIDPIDASSPMAGMLPIIAEGSKHADWSVFDLRPLLPHAKALSAGNAEVMLLIQGYDFVVVIPKGTASAPL